MSTNNIDKQITDKLKNRKLQPSASAWERLNTQLDEQETKKKKNWFLYVGYAASIMLLFSLGVSYFTTNNTNNLIEKEIVKTTLDSVKVNNPIQKIISAKENAIATIVKEEKKKEKAKTESIKTVYKEELSIAKNVEKPKLIKKVIKPQLEETIIAEITNDKEVLKEDKTSYKKVKSRIKINSEDLLFAVTHSSEEVKEYYAKNKLKRKDIFNSIKEELNKSNLKIDPNIILAEVEKSIQDDEFKGNFMQKLKLKISDIAIAIADRNK